MKFDIKKKIGNVLNSFRMEITLGHGDGDHFETLYLGPYQYEDLFIIAGIEKAFKEMEESDKKSNNEMDYDNCVNFRRFLKKHWKYDLYATVCDIYRHAYVKRYKIFHTDENGVEYEIKNLECIEEPRRYFYIKVDIGPSFSFFAEWDIITTYKKLEPKILDEWVLVELENGEEFINQYHFEEVEIDRENFDEEEEFLITHHYEKLPMETDEEEENFYEVIDKLKIK